MKEVENDFLYKEVKIRKDFSTLIYHPKLLLYGLLYAHKKAG